MRNRINAYEDRHKRSEAELSESTRPDLSVPLPDLPHLQPEDNEANDKSYRPSSSSAAAATSGGSSSQPHGGQASTAMDGSTILRIPKVPKTVPPPSASPSPAGEPTKIRVRTDLMHQLGLMSNTGDANTNTLNDTFSKSTVSTPFQIPMQSIGTPRRRQHLRLRRGTPSTLTTWCRRPRRGLPSRK